MLLGKRI